MCRSFMMFTWCIYELSFDIKTLLHMLSSIRRNAQWVENEPKWRISQKLLHKIVQICLCFFQQHWESSQFSVKKKKWVFSDNHTISKNMIKFIQFLIIWELQKINTYIGAYWIIMSLIPWWKLVSLFVQQRIIFNV